MARTFSPQVFVNVPRGDAGRTHTLILQAVNHARVVQANLAHEGHAMPPLILRALDRLELLAADLYRALSTEPDPPGADRKGADQALDHAWGAFKAALDAWLVLPTANQPRMRELQDAVRSLIQEVFPDGLRFLAEDYYTEYHESSKKLDLLARKETTLLLTRLSLDGMVDVIQDAHQTYAEALGLSNTVPAPTVPAVREKLEAANASLREYIVKVVAWSDPLEPGSAELSETLLTPMTQWP